MCGAGLLWLTKNRDMVTGGNVLASGAQPPASVTNVFQSSLLKILLLHPDTRTDRVTY
jgi:hypothetical protein